MESEQPELNPYVAPLAEEHLAVPPEGQELTSPVGLSLWIGGLIVVLVLIVAIVG
ncbi:hypothetical protein [Aeoliella mucimassa]|uniref:Uncharacterized protein n=1 Tax=Aeoliella mucimassa TaxID=2527972 RepID=A0A518ASJ5_9BACT|nr:hypothetical protein [Aeoliella mucimassa]QDU57701.1 hypothetical protein Pan181_39230 [Aeoliella mucimassa]